MEQIGFVMVRDTQTICMKYFPVLNLGKRTFTNCVFISTRT